MRNAGCRHKGCAQALRRRVRAVLLTAARMAEDDPLRLPPELWLHVLKNWHTLDDV